MNNSENYHVEILANDSRPRLMIREIWEYRDLIMLFAKKNFTVSYKQTILGPLWLFISPFLSSLVYMLIFGKIAGLSTGGVPQLLFYLSSTALWSFFSASLTTTAGTFVNHAGLYGKVYFPRLTIPISNCLSSAVKFTIQFMMVLIILIRYIVLEMIDPNFFFWILIPAIIIQLGMLGMGTGLIISSVTVKYRDLAVLVSLGMQLWMYSTPVVYPLSQLSEGKLRSLLMVNPVTMPMELYRYAVLGTGSISAFFIIVSWLVTLLVFLCGVLLFNHAERNFMDTI